MLKPPRFPWGFAAFAFVLVAAGVLALHQNEPRSIVERALAPQSSSGAAGSTVQGVPRVLDGDTIVVAGTHVRLNGIDAEEIAHSGKASELHGEAARAGMQEIVGIGAPVRCDLNGERTYNRLVGVCFNARGQDIGAELIRKGLALDCAHYSGGRYRKLEPAGARQRLIQKPYC